MKYNLTKTILNLSVICALLTLGSGVFAQETKEANRPVAEKAETLGIVKEKPESGPAIEIEGGFMVPYEATIPGTDVKYTMLPIPGGKFMMGSPEDE